MPQDQVDPLHAACRDYVIPVPPGRVSPIPQSWRALRLPVHPQQDMSGASRLSRVTMIRGMY